MPATDPLLPVGTVRLGRRTDGQTVNGRNAHFYGLLDDVAVFTSALTQAQVQSLVATKHLTGSEAHLLAGYPFTTGAHPPSLGRTTTLRQGAARVGVSAVRDSAASDSYDRTVVDAVMAEAKALRGRVGKGDQQKLDQYLDKIRNLVGDVWAEYLAGRTAALS